MESAKSGTEEEDEPFFDASEDFPLYDCVESRTSGSSNAPKREMSTVRRRRPVPCHLVSGKEFEESSSGASSVFSREELIDEPGLDCRKNRSLHNRESMVKDKDVEKTEMGPGRVDSLPFGISECRDRDETTVATVGEQRGAGSGVSVGEAGESSSANWSFLVFLTGFVVKAMEFQFSLLIRLFSLPLWALYGCCLILFDPFGALKRFMRYSTSTVSSSWNSVSGNMSPFVQDWVEGHKMLKIGHRFGWGLFWGAYVGCVLSALLISSLLFSGLMIKSYVEEPIVIKESLSFDYTKNSPTAYLPIISCASVDCDANCIENIEAAKILGLRVIPPKHQLQVTVSLVLPESVYNRNLGMFQVRIDLLASDGRALASSRHPCMLKFRSETIHLLHTFFRIVPLIAGYESESQTLNLKFRGFLEKEVPTACVRVMIEQRAEFRPGAGVPELYDASLVLESELPFFKRIAWFWKNTLFVWTSMTFFITELILALLCCRPLVVPRVGQSDRIHRPERQFLQS